jgi:hypothetical protein
MIIAGKPEDRNEDNLRKRLAEAEARCASLEKEFRELQRHADCLEQDRDWLRRERDDDRRLSAATSAWDQGLRDLFNRLAREMLDGGWDWLRDRWVMDPEQSSAHGSRSGGDGDISVIPGTGGACTETVLVFLSDRDWPHRFHSRHASDAMETLKIHLVECQKVQRVMVLSDTIHTPSFDKDYLRWIRAWSGRGVTFGHALVAPDRRTLLPVPLGV